MTSLVATLVVFALAGGGFVLANLAAGRLVRPSHPGAAKGQPYECGEPPAGPPAGQFDLRFYVVALLFVIFDVEVAFFFPWAVAFGTAARADADPAAGAFARLAFAELLAFLGVLLVGFAYLWRRGDLEWVRSVAGQAHPEQSPPVPPGGSLESSDGPPGKPL